MGLRPQGTALVRAFAVMLVVFSATSTLFVGSALAAAACIVNPASGVVGNEFSVSCTGFAPNEQVRIFWDVEPTSPSSPGNKGSFSTSGTGAGATSIVVPDTVSGDHTVWTYGASSGVRASATFAVVPNIRTSTTIGAPGSSLSAALTGYPAGESVTVKWRHDATTIVNVKTVTIGLTGKATAIATVPDAVAGDHTVEADDDDATTTNPTTTYTVVPVIKISPTTAKVGNNVTVTVRGYDAGEAVAINWVASGTPVNKANTVTDGFGKGTAAFTIPQSAMGSYEVQGDGATNDASLSFPVVPSVDLNASSYFVHDEVAVAFDGYPAMTEITINWFNTTTTSQAVGTATTDANGHADATFEVLEATRGSHKVEGFVNSSTKASALSTVKPSIAIDPAMGVDGDEVDVHLHGFNANESVNIQWYASLSVAVAMTPVLVNALGSGDGTFDVPTGSTNGTHQVKADGMQDASATYTVDNPPVNEPAECLLDRTTGAIGLLVEVTCSNYDPNETVNVYWDSAATTAIGSFLADANGAGATDINVPAGSANGAHAVLTVGATSAEQTSDAFTVIAGPSCTLSDLNDTVGVQGIFNARINFSCTGFLAGELVRVYWDSTTNIARASVSATSTGTVSGFFKIPEASSGTHSVFVTGNTSKYQTSGSVTVDANMSVTPTTAAVGVSPTVRMTGFGNGETLTLQWLSGTTLVGPAKVTTAASSGSKTITYTVPQTPAGAYTLRVTGATTGKVITKPFTIVASMTLFPTTGTPGSSLKILMQGYQANEDITVTWRHDVGDILTMTEATADSNGTFELNTTIPVSTRGGHLIQAEGADGTSKGRTFTIQSAMDVTKISGTVGTSVTVVLKGWAAGEQVTMNWTDGAAVRTLTTVPVTTNSYGRAQFVVTVPETYEGAHTITATGEGATPTTRFKNFIVTPSIALSPTSGPVGTTVTVTLKGFGKTSGGAPEAVEIRFFSDASTSSIIKTVTVNANGSATTTIVIPATSITSHKIEGKGVASLAKAYKYFVVQPIS